MNRFRKPEPATQAHKFVCRYVGPTDFEVEADDFDGAIEAAADMIREEVYARIQIVSSAPVVRSHVGPTEWADAVAAEGGEYDRVAIEVGSSDWWLTNGHIALRAHGPQPAGKALNMPCHEPDDPVEPTKRVKSGSLDLVKLGTRCAQERYLWLVEELFGRCQWHECGLNAFVAVTGGKVVAMVMRCLSTKEDAAEPFVEVSNG